MTTDPAIPAPAPRTETKLYRFPPARPCALPADQCSDADLRRIISDALGNRSDLLALLGSPEHLLRVLDLAQRIDAQLAARTAELVGERLEVVRLAKLHRDLSRQLVEVQALHRGLVAECSQLRRRLEQVDGDLAEQTLRFGAVDDDTLVVSVSLPPGGGW